MTGRNYYVRVFGAAAVHVDGQPLHLTGNMRKTLCLIVAAGPDGLSIDRALTEAADGDGSATAQSRMRMDVSRLRKRIGADLLPNATGVWRLDLDPGSVDYFALQHLSSTDALPDSTTLAPLLRGRPFHDASPTPLIASAVSATDTARLGVMRRMLDQPSLIDPATLVAGRELLDDDPLNEELIAAVVEHHLEVDQLTTARDILFTAAINFHEMLGAELPDRLTKFETVVGEIRPPLPGNGVPNPSPGRPGVRVRVVGREAEEDAVVTWIEDDDGSALVLTGPSGSGKTTMINTLVDEARAQGFSIIRAIGREFDRRPYSSIASALGPEFRMLIEAPAIQQSEVWAAALAELSDQDSTRTLLVVDDAQWLDSLSRDLVLFLLRAKSEQVGVVLSGRPTEAGVWRSIENHARGDAAKVIELEGLQAHDIEQLVVELRPGTRLALRRRLAVEVHAASNGLPAVAVQLIKNAKGSTLQIHQVSAGDGLGWFVDGLPPEAQQVGLAAAVVGHRVSYPQISELADTSDIVLLESLESLAVQGVLIPDAAPGYVSFAHALIREAFLEHADESELHRLRQQAAASTADPHRKAELLDGAGPDVPASVVASAIRISADLNLENGALTEAVSAYERADVLQASNDPSLLSRWAGAVDRLGLDGAPLRHRAFEQALADGSLDAALEAAVSGLPHAEQPAGDPARISLLEEIDMTLLTGRSQFIHSSTLARQHAVAGNSAQALDLNRLAETLIETDADADAVSRVQWLASCAITSPGERLDNDAFYPAFKGELPHSVQLMYAVDYLGAGRVDDALNARAAVESSLVPESDPMSYWHCKLLESTLLAAAGKHDDARAVSDQAFDFGVRYGVREAAAAWMAQIFIESWMSEPDGAATFLGLMEALQPAEVQDSFLPQAALCVALKQLGENEQAVSLASDLVTLALPHQSFAGTATLAMTARVLGAEDPLSSQMFDALAPLSGSLIVVGGGFVCVGPADAALAHLSSGAERTRRFQAAAETVNHPELVGWQALVAREASGC